MDYSSQTFVAELELVAAGGDVPVLRLSAVSVVGGGEAGGKAVGCAEA